MRLIATRITVLGAGLLLSFPSQIFAASLRRDQVVGYELQCVSQSRKAVGWSDVCATENFIRDQREKQITQALDAFSPGANISPKPSAQPGIIRESKPVPAPPAEVQPLKPKPVVKKVVIPKDKVAPPPRARVQPKAEQAARQSERAVKKHSFEVSPEIYYYSYDEPGVMNQDGIFYGYSGQYTYRPQENDPFYLPGMFYRVQGQWAQAKLDYTSNSTGELRDKQNYTYEARGLLGANIPLDSPLRLSAYSGLGYRYLLDESSGRQSTTGAWGYDRHQEYVYVPLGFSGRFQANSSSTMDGDIEFDYLFWGHNKSDLGYLAGYNDLEFNQKSGYGIRASLKLTKNVGAVDLFVEPFWRYWNIASSNVVGGMIEPENNTKEFGLKVGAQF